MRWLPVVVIAAALVAVNSSRARPEPLAEPRLPALGNDEAWQRLPRTEPPLPAWARVLARPLPQTTGAMLELDYLHRVDNPLGAVAAGKLRWAAADALGCDYGRRYAEADLRRAGLTDADLRKLAGDAAGMADDDRLALAFARKLTRAAETVTDAEVAALLERFGPEKVVAMVHTLAYANFQNRIFLALGVAVEPGGPLPPLAAKLDAAKRAGVPTPPRPPVQAATGAAAPSETRPGWRERDFGELQAALDRQKGRAPRIPLPDAGRMAGLPPEAKAQASRINWAAVSMGYQPRLTAAWFDCMGIFQREAQLDRVFSNTFFWVVNRSNECFY
jgi:alkylhydroperoxidase family enzyme